MSSNPLAINIANFTEEARRLIAMAKDRIDSAMDVEEGSAAPAYEEVYHMHSGRGSSVCYSLLPSLSSYTVDAELKRSQAKSTGIY